MRVITTAYLGMDAFVTDEKADGVVFEKPLDEEIADRFKYESPPRYKKPVKLVSNFPIKPTL